MFDIHMVGEERDITIISCDYFKKEVTLTLRGETYVDWFEHILDYYAGRTKEECEMDNQSSRENQPKTPVYGFQRTLKQLRRERRISRQTASELCGLSPDALRRYERGEATPSLESLIKMADFFGVTIDYLVGRNQQKST